MEEKKIDMGQENVKNHLRKADVFRNGIFLEVFAFVCFLILSVIMFIYHEPWYDEIQAWMVASDASMKEMLFELPHFEGHPPVWTLLLALFAKMGVPMEIGLRIPALLFSGIAAFLVIFKAPFHKWIRCLIPFTYFLFYQYTVICRPYSMMFLGFVLAAMFYKERNKKPVRYLLSLYLLCLSSAYGILFAAVLCLIWTVEIVKELWGKNFMQKAIRDKRTWSLVVMLILSLGLLLIIWPADNAFAQVRVVEFSKLRCLIYTFLVLPADALLTDVSLMGRLQQVVDTIIQLDAPTILCIVISILLYFVIIVAAHIYKKKALFIWPYVAFAGYAALGYFYNHHIGIVPLFLLFAFWCALSDRPEELKLPGFLKKLEEKSQGLCKKTGYFFVVLSLSMSIFWTISAVINDIRLPVWYAKDLAAVMEEYGLDQYRVVNQWTYEKKATENTSEDVQTEMAYENEDGYLITTEIEQVTADEYHQYVKMCNFVDILAYSEEKDNYISNFNNGDSSNRYVNHDMLSQEESLVYLEELGAQGYPEVIIGEPEILGMMGLDVNEYMYIPIYNIKCYRINKYNTIYASSFVFVREDIYATREDWPIYEQNQNGYTK